MGGDRGAILIPECVAVETTHTAPRDITALEIIPDQTEHARASLSLFPRARLEVCRDGFNDRTLKIR
jgi:hypothetical protein